MSAPGARAERSPALRLLALTLVASFLAFAASVPVQLPGGDGALIKESGALIRGDGLGYFMHVRSVVVDHDLDFTNERAHFAGRVWLPAPPNTNKFASVGMLLLWLPFYLAAHALALVAHALGAGGIPDGYGYGYQAAVCIGSIVYGSVGMALAFEAARRVHGDRAAAWAVGTFALASPFVFYLLVMPYMSHMSSFFVVAAMMFVWLVRVWPVALPRLREFCALGLLAGLVMTVRVQDALFLLIPFGGAAWRIAAAWRRGERSETARWLVGGTLAAALALALFSLQLYTWHSMYGIYAQSPLQVEQGARTFHWSRPELWAVLFSTHHGLFSWHPVLLLATGGIVLHARRDGFFALAALAAIAMQVYVVASWWGWSQGDSFGGRIFLNCGIFWVIGLAAGFAWASAQPWRARAAAAAVVLVVWNGLSLVQYTLGFVARGAPLSIREMTFDRLLVPVRVLERLRSRS